MESNIIKEGYKAANDALKEKQVETVKQMVLKTLEKLEDVRKDIRDTQETERILKMDLEDIKLGKLDRIVERQEKDPKAKEVSVVIIIKEKEVIRECSPWYWPYVIQWNYPTYVSQATVFNTGGSFNTMGSVNTYTLTSATNAIGYAGSANSINCSVAKDAAIGTYEVAGNIVNFR